ncbi:DUF2059 domain-containing protein [Actibacterium sp. D379-3]
MIRRLLPMLALVVLVLPARAAPSEDLDRLITALRLPEVVGIMTQEGIAYGDELEQEMFPARGGPRWRGMVATIYDADRLTGMMAQELATALDDTDLGPLIAFYEGPLGSRITGLEISARQALLDPAVEEASIEAWQMMQADDDPRLALLEEFVAVNDLVEMNVVGGLNANFAFYTGLNDGGAFPQDLAQQDMLRDVWSQEEAVRADTVEWLFSYLAMAYRPLDDGDLRGYIALSETSAGQALNRALFQGFDVMFRQVSRELGLGAAQFIAGQDI